MNVNDDVAMAAAHFFRSGQLFFNYYRCRFFNENAPRAYFFGFSGSLGPSQSTTKMSSFSFAARDICCVSCFDFSPPGEEV